MTGLSLNTIRARALVTLVRLYPRMPLHALYALPELAQVSRESIGRALDAAVAEGWIEQNPHGELVAPDLDAAA